MSNKKSKLISIIVIFMMVLLTCVIPKSISFAAGTVYYISSSSGNDSNNGTSTSTPWKTLTKASTITFQPGDQILLKSGDTWTNETFYPHGESNATNPILISSYGTGNRPVISPGTTAVYGIKLIDISGYKITNLEFTGGYCGISVWYENTYNHDYMWIENCYFHDMHMPEQYYQPNAPIFSMDLWFAVAVVVGFLDNDATHTVLSNTTVKGCTFLNVDCGVRDQPYYGTMQNPQTPYLCSNSELLNFNITNCNFNRSYLSGAVMLYSVEGGGVTDCVVDNTGVYGMWYGTAGVQYTNCNDLICLRTELKNTKAPGGCPDGAGFDFEGGNNNITLKDCNIHDNDGYGFMAFGGGGKGFNTNNVIDNCTLTNNNALQQISNMAFEVCANNSGSITNCQVHLQNDGQTYNDFTAMTFDNTNQVWNTGGTLVFPASPTPTPASGNRAAGKIPTGSVSINNASRATDGDKTSANFADLSAINLQWIQIDLGSSYNINNVNLWHYFADGRKYHDVIVALSNDSTFGTKTVVFNNDTDNTAGLGAGSDAEYTEASAGNTITFSPVNARYIRLWTNGNSVNASNHYVEVEAYDTGSPTPTPTPTPTPASGNRAAGKIPTGSVSINNASRATDGDKDSANFTDLSATNLQWIQIDLGESYDVNNVNLWHFFADQRTYHDVIVALSNDSTFATKTIVFNNDTNNSAGLGTGSDAEYPESATGRTITFSPVNARYIRLWTNGNSVNISNHYVEVEVFDTGNKAAGKIPTGSVSINNASRTTDGDKNSANFADLSAINLQWIQIDLGSSSNINNVNLWHFFADGRKYHDVIVALSNDSTFGTKTVVFNNDTDNTAGLGAGSDAEYTEASAGKTITFSPINARYIRLWTNGNTVNSSNHYVEVEVLGN